MRFPLGLAADLAVGRTRQILRGSFSYPLIQHLSIFAASPDSATPLASDDCLAALRASSAPVVWIGGLEPLLHPEIGRLARRIVDAGRHVFVETDGTRLHRRIHEFRPVSRLFLTVKFRGVEKRHDQDTGRDGTFREALDGIRTAKLSGFLVCAHLIVDAGTQIAELKRLREVLLQKDVDGFVVSPAREYAKAAHARGEDLEVQRRLGETRALMPGRRWRWFSRLLNDSLTAARSGAPTPNGELDRHGASEAPTCEESVEAS